MSRHMFAGANTPDGFFSYFNHIMPFSEATKTIYLKGASGTGKSSFMNKIGCAFEAMGYDIEYIHCSNDAKSLDGVCIKDLNISVIDGTAPHIYDPSAPIAIDEILNIADYINREYIEEYAEELRTLQLAKKQFFDKAYGYFSAAYKIHLNNAYIYDKLLSKPRLNKKIIGAMSIFQNIELDGKVGKNRKLFASAVTPDGLKNHIDCLMNTKKVYALYGSDGMGMDIMLSKIQQEANLCGLDTESFYCSLNSDKLEHLIIPEMEVSFTTANKYHSISIPVTDEIHFMDCINLKTLSLYEEEIEYNDEIFNQLLQKSMDTMKASKQIHNRIENIYLESMNFKKLDDACKKTIKNLKRFI